MARSAAGDPAGSGAMCVQSWQCHILWKNQATLTIEQEFLVHKYPAQNRRVGLQEFREKINLHFPSFSSRIIKEKKNPYLSVVAMPEVCLPRFAFNLTYITAEN